MKTNKNSKTWAIVASLIVTLIGLSSQGCLAQAAPDGTGASADDVSALGTTTEAMAMPTWSTSLTPVSRAVNVNSLWQLHATPKTGRLMIGLSAANVSYMTFAPGATNRPLYRLIACAYGANVETNFLGYGFIGEDGVAAVAPTGLHYFTNLKVSDGATGNVLMGPSEISSGIYVTPEGWPAMYVYFSDPFTVAKNTCKELVFSSDIANVNYTDPVSMKRFKVYLSHINAPSATIYFSGGYAPEPATIVIR